VLFEDCVAALVTEFTVEGKVGRGTVESQSHDSVKGVLLVLFLEKEIVRVVHDEFVCLLRVVAQFFVHFSLLLNSGREHIKPLILIGAESKIFVAFEVDSVTLIAEDPIRNPDFFDSVLSVLLYNRTGVPN